jgi:hypothetical protein
MISEVQVRLAGGIGNQIFQFIAGKMVAEKFGAKFASNFQAFDATNLHVGSDIRELEFFNSDFEISNRSYKYVQRFYERVKIKLAKKSKLLSRLLNLYCDDYVDFEQLERFTGTLQLSGYFQTRQVVDFTSKNYPVINLQPRNLSMKFTTALNHINGEFCAIHIRRGDYLHKGSIHKELTSDYYLRALNFMREKSEGNLMKFVVFSDEPELTSVLLPSDLVYIQAAEFKLSTVEELYLMSHAAAFVIANSTFSFWPAFLAKAECPVVVPDNWFKSGSQSINEIFPSYWNLISS